MINNHIHSHPGSITMNGTKFLLILTITLCLTGSLEKAQRRSMFDEFIVALASLVSASGNKTKENEEVEENSGEVTNSTSG